MAPGFTTKTHSLAETQTLAGCFASMLQAGMVVGLNGPLGAGKSAFARFVITAACPEIDDIPSPTFTLVQTYESKTHLPIWHMDLYRLDAPEEAFALGIEDGFYEAACLVEWPDKLGGYWPDGAWSVTITPLSHTERHLEFTGPETALAHFQAMILKSGLSLQ